MQLSARNQLKAKVKSVRLGTIMAEVIATIGDQEIVSAITRASAESLSLKPGDDVIIVIKATEVLVAKA
jgi:molybdopterin-binding protein